MLKKLIKHSAFTMAEILLSLTIIGVVAAITLPSLTGNINERTWNTQRKALYSRMSQAIALMPAINGYGTASKGTYNNNYLDRKDATADLFITNGLSKVLKLNNICDADHLGDCGLPNKILGLNGKAAFSSFPTGILELCGANKQFDDGEESLKQNMGYDMKVAAFETANGESVAVYYNPICKTRTDFSQGATMQHLLCANFIYDLNGKKGPNTMGKDMGFMSLFYATDSSLVAPVVVKESSSSTVTFSEAQRACRSYEDSRLPNLEEAGALFFNKELLGVNASGVTHDCYWSATASPNGGRYAVSSDGSYVYNRSTSESELYRCVKRN